MELTILMPCLNEADTIESCIAKAMKSIRELGLEAEVLIADNGSTDGSQALAIRAGARVVQVAAQGYGHALMGGIREARGSFILMGDADDSYDFGDLAKFIGKLREGNELVQGCRLPSGGGTVLPGAMPFLHRRLGNPMFSLMARCWFRAPIHDVYCGMRGFTKALYERLDQQCTGMEFATEMIIKASLYRARIAEVPITLHPDGRKSHAPHLKTFRDGWRTLRFFLLFSPRWLFLLPGGLLILLGLIGYGVALPGVRIGGIQFDAHTLVFASLFILCGYQSILFAIFSKTFAVNEGLVPADARLAKFYEAMNLERGLLLSAIVFVVGAGLLLAAIEQWRMAGFGSLNYAATMRLVVPGATLTALAFQTMLSSFFVSILGMHRK